jgi:hypothetical protein
MLAYDLSIINQIILSLISLFAFFDFNFGKIPMFNGGIYKLGKFDPESKYKSPVKNKHSINAMDNSGGNNNSQPQGSTSSDTKVLTYKTFAADNKTIVSRNLEVERRKEELP